MSFADELKKNSMEYDPNLKSIARIKNKINMSVEAIKYGCNKASREGKNEIEGFVYIYSSDSLDIAQVSKNSKGLRSGNGILFEGYSKEEEGQIIEGIRDKVSKLGFDSFVIKSYHPGQVCDGSKKVGAAIFRTQRSVPTYRSTNGFCIEVHCKW